MNRDRALLWLLAIAVIALTAFAIWLGLSDAPADTGLLDWLRRRP